MPTNPNDPLQYKPIAPWLEDLVNKEDAKLVPAVPVVKEPVKTEAPAPVPVVVEPPKVEVPVVVPVVAEPVKTEAPVVPVVPIATPAPAVVVTPAPVVPASVVPTVPTK
jgi:hypothetical protein